MLAPLVILWPEVRITSEYDEEKAEALRRSMVELGQQDAVGVIQLEDGTYEGSAGMNRCMAAIQSGAAEILCVVRQGSHRDVVKANLATSINQSKANPLSEVEGIANAHFVEGFGIDELAQLTGMSPAWVDERILVSQATEPVKQCLRDRRIAMGHAVLLARVEDLTAQEEALAQRLRHGWSVRELEEYLRGPGVDDGQPNAEGPRTPRQRKPPGPQVCHCCSKEHAAAEVQIITVCNGCAPTVGPSPTAVGEGEVAVSVDLMREAETALAGAPATAGLAEQIATLLEQVAVTA